MVSQVQSSIETYWLINADSAEPPLVWDAFKAVKRKECISAIKAARKEHIQEGELLLAKEWESVRVHVDSPSEENYVSLLETLCSVSMHFINLAHTDS